jgi:hypothetical protein
MNRHILGILTNNKTSDGLNNFTMSARKTFLNKLTPANTAIPPEENNLQITIKSPT